MSFLLQTIISVVPLTVIAIFAIIRRDKKDAQQAILGESSLLVMFCFHPVIYKCYSKHNGENYTQVVSQEFTN